MIPGDPGDVWSWTAGAAPAAPTGQASRTSIATGIGIGFCLFLILAL